MFDARLRRLIDPPLNRIGARLAAAGITADQLTWAGFAVGMIACGFIALGWTALALVLVLVSRLADGLDGAVARATRKTDRGGFLDITLDFIFYAAAPAAFALYDPGQNALTAALLLVTYMANGSSFLAFAIMQEKRGQETTAQGRKSLYYMSGLAEGGETILVICLWCLFPSWFTPIAAVWGVLVALSAAGRIAAANRLLRD